MTDDTSMAMVIAEVGIRWCDWAKSAPDVGHQTQRCLDDAERAAAGGPMTADHFLSAASAIFEQGRAGGSGSLMRTGPVALAYLHDTEELTQAARQLSDLTHADPQAGQACLLWCHAIVHAVLVGRLDIGVGLPSLDEAAASDWRD